MLNKNKIILFLIIILVVAGVGFYYLNKKINTLPQVPKKITLTPIQGQKSTPINHTSTANNGNDYDRIFD